MVIPDSLACQQHMANSSGVSEFSSHCSSAASAGKMVALPSAGAPYTLAPPHNPPPPFQWSAFTRGNESLGRLLGMKSLGKCGMLEPHQRQASAPLST